MKKERRTQLYSLLNDDIICEHKVGRVLATKKVIRHNHDGYEFIFFLGGDVNLYVESIGKKLERGDLVIIPPYTFHGSTLTDVSSYERIVLNVRPRAIKFLEDDDTEFEPVLNRKSTGQLNLIHISEEELHQYVTLLDNLQASLNSEQFGHSILTKAYLTEFLVLISAYLYKNTPAEFDNITSPLITKIFKYIDANMSENITIEEISESLHHNSDYLGRLFKETTGETLKYYITAKKISLAQKYLDMGYSPYDVCDMIGYNNYSSFSRRFSAHVGMSPKQYQQHLKARYIL